MTTLPVPKATWVTSLRSTKSDRIVFLLQNSFLILSNGTKCIQMYFKSTGKFHFYSNYFVLLILDMSPGLDLDLEDYSIWGILSFYISYQSLSNDILKSTLN